MATTQPFHRHAERADSAAAAGIDDIDRASPLHELPARLRRQHYLEALSPMRYRAQLRLLVANGAEPPGLQCSTITRAPRHGYTLCWADVKPAPGPYFAST